MGMNLSIDFGAGSASKGTVRHGGIFLLSFIPEATVAVDAFTRSTFVASARNGREAPSSKARRRVTRSTKGIILTLELSPTFPKSLKLRSDDFRNISAS